MWKKTTEAIKKSDSFLTECRVEPKEDLLSHAQLFKL